MSPWWAAAAAAVCYVVFGALILQKLEPGWKFTSAVFFIVNVAAGVGYGEYDHQSLGAVYFAGFYVCLLGGAMLLSILVFAASSLLDFEENVFHRHGAWHRLSGGGRRVTTLEDVDRSRILLLHFSTW